MKKTCFHIGSKKGNRLFIRMIPLFNLAVDNSLFLTV